MMLDLAALANDGSKIISGKERGIQARAHFQLDACDQSNETIDVVLPTHVKVITPSFVLGMFAKSVLKCGSVEAFLSKFHFNTTPLVLDQISQGAKLSLIEGHALS